MALRLMLCIRRHESIGAEQFMEKWRLVEETAMAGFREVFKPSRLLVSLPTQSERNQYLQQRYRVQPGYDAIVQICFDSPEQMPDVSGTPQVTVEMMKLYTEFMPFMDLERSAAFYVEEPREV